MNEKSKQQTVTAELEARFVALILGEASDFEREQLEQLAANQPELAALQAELEHVHGLMQEAAQPVAASGDDQWKLSADRRKEVLSVIGEASRPKDESTASLAKQTSSWDRTATGLRRYRKLILGLGLAGCLSGVALSLRLGSSRSLPATVAMREFMTDSAEPTRSRTDEAQGLTGGTDLRYFSNGYFPQSEIAPIELEIQAAQTMLDDNLQGNWDRQMAQSTAESQRRSAGMNGRASFGFGVSGTRGEAQVQEGESLGEPEQSNSGAYAGGRFGGGEGWSGKPLSAQPVEEQAARRSALSADDSIVSRTLTDSELDSKLYSVPQTVPDGGSILLGGIKRKSNRGQDSAGDANTRSWGASGNELARNMASEQFESELFESGAERQLAELEAKVESDQLSMGETLSFAIEQREQGFVDGYFRGSESLAAHDKDKDSDGLVASEDLLALNMPTQQFDSGSEDRFDSRYVQPPAPTSFFSRPSTEEFDFSRPQAATNGQGVWVAGTPVVESQLSDSFFDTHGNSDAPSTSQRSQTPQLPAFRLQTTNGADVLSGLADAPALSENMGDLSLSDASRGLGLQEEVGNEPSVGQGHEQLGRYRDADLHIGKTRDEFGRANETPPDENSFGNVPTPDSRIANSALRGIEEQLKSDLSGNAGAGIQMRQDVAWEEEHRDFETSENYFEALRRNIAAFPIELSDTTAAKESAMADLGESNADWYGYIPPSRMPAKKRKLERESSVVAAEDSAATKPFSTFSLHVSDVSFKLAAAALAKGEWPKREQVRIEEFVNAFDYGDAMPSTEQRVGCTLEQCIHPFQQQRNMLRVAMRTAAAGRASTTPLRLTLLLDNSGSMERHDRRQTVQRAFALLAQQLRPEDQVTLISFASQPRLLADRVTGDKAAELTRLVNNLPSEGGTNIEAALALAFEKAQEQFAASAQNRVVLLTDGAVNLGDADPSALAQSIESMRLAGVAFDAAGIIADGLNDEVLEALTRKGDGRYYLLDSAASADDSFAQQIAGAMRPAAKNVKVQIEFNPERVGNYKLLGFEKHILKQEDFRNDSVDAAEMAAAEAGVAVYQFEPKPDGQGDVGSVSVRFLDLSTGQMVEQRWPIPYQPQSPRLDQATPSIRIATTAALFAAKLRDDPVGASVDLAELSSVTASLPDALRRNTKVAQLHEMIEQSRQIGGK